MPTLKYSSHLLFQKAKRPCSTDDPFHSGTEGGGGGGAGEEGDTTPENRDDEDGDEATAPLSDGEKELRLALPSSSSSGSGGGSGGGSNGGGGGGGQSAGRSSTSSSSTVAAAAATPKVSVAVVTADGLAFIDSEYKCDYCLLTSECNRVGLAEDLLYCKDCQAKGERFSCTFLEAK